MHRITIHVNGNSQSGFRIATIVPMDFQSHYGHREIETQVVFSLPTKGGRAARAAMDEVIQKHPLPWITRNGATWIIDQDALLEFLIGMAPTLARFDYLKGKAVCNDPDVETEERKTSEGYVLGHSTAVTFYLIPGETMILSESEERMTMANVPPELTDSLKRFREDYPDPAMVGFIIMRFGTTDAHKKIVEGIRECLKSHDMAAVRADDKEYHDDLFWNVMTYIYGCGIGLAVFERLASDDHNPNVAYEVGYMSAIGKPVCLLKDETIKTLQTDLVSKLYRQFNPQNPEATIPPVLTKWMKDKGLIQKKTP